MEDGGVIGAKSQEGSHCPLFSEAEALAHSPPTVHFILDSEDGIFVEMKDILPPICGFHSTMQIVPKNVVRTSLAQANIEKNGPARGDNPEGFIPHSQDIRFVEVLKNIKACD